VQIATGTRLGSYEILDALGAGGMGVVYRAADARLGRHVAIKLLPEALARDDDALARFEREARFLASLNHPNIAAIYGIEEHAGERFLVLEYVPGDTLEDLLTQGPLPPDRTLRIGLQVASALEAAHEANIIHRDLKPSNVKVTPEGRVKLIDFGIAKHAAAPVGEDDDTVLTRAGSIMGTPQFMSPEQVFGEPVDRRADIWAFGCLLFEMLTGRRAFPGRTFLEVADAVRTREPDWSALPHGTGEPLRRVIVRCLKKDPHDRLRDIGDARVELEDAATELAGSRRQWGSRSTIALGAAGVVALLVLTAVVTRRSARGSDRSPSTVTLKQFTSANGVEQFPAWSGDGSSIVFSGDAGGVRKLFIRAVGSGEQRQLTTGPFDDVQPSWSLDGRRILFVRAREPNHRLEPGDYFGPYEANTADIWSIDPQSHREIKVVENAFEPSIAPDGRAIAVGASWAGPRRIWLVDANGLNPQQLTSDSSEAVNHMLPHWSPDGQAIVYQRMERTKFDISVVSVGSRKSVNVTSDNYRKINPVWSKDGRWIYFSSDRAGGMNLWRIAVGAGNKPDGTPQQITSGAGQDVQIAVAPDGARLAYATLRQNADVWRMPLAADGSAAGPPVPVIATTREDSRGAWSPDGRMIAFNSDRAGDMNIWVLSLGDGSTRQITRGTGGDFQPTWSPDGKELVFFSSRAGKTDIWKVNVASGALAQITHGHSLDINPFFSPVGREIVYQSDVSGRLELWIMQSDGSAPRQLTNVGVSGHFERWRDDGFIYFRCPTTHAVMKIAPTGGEPQIVSPNGGAHISFLPDGKTFVDITGHQVLWRYPLDGKPAKLFEFSDPEVRIDYPVVSPDGRWLLFDRFRPEGGDLWIAGGLR
jgi:Tol biopolymer transport system component